MTQTAPLQGPAAGPTAPSGQSWPPVGPPPGPEQGNASRPGGRRPAVAVMTAAVVAALVGGAAGFGGAYLAADASAPGTVLGSVPSAATSTADGTVAGAAAVATPSTVDIRVTTASGAAEGSGVILSADGAVLTNNHVVSAAGGGTITITLADGSQHAATVVGTSPSYDLAVLRMEGVSGLTPATLGSSADLTVGQQVVAIGSPQGLEGTVTTGIVSALNRTVAVSGENGDAVVYNGLQTDAPINQGNSGGPLVDLSGHVVGINSAIATAGQQSTGSIGLGFAIPVDQARRVAQEILDTGVATKPLLGLQGGGSTTSGGPGAGSAAAADTGATIQAVTAGSPAADAGLVAGDTVLQVGDARVADFTDLVARIGAHAPGESVTLTVRTADGQQRQVQVTLASTPDRAATSSNRVVPGGLN